MITRGIVGLLVMVCLSATARGQGTTNPYPKMAPLEQYLMERNAEIALARSAAPDSISRDAQVLAFGRHGYEEVVSGKNGFVCVVMRSWTADRDDPGFWNPKLRSPICFNAPAARSFWPIMVKRTELVLAGVPKEQMLARITASIDSHELPSPEVGAMSYMMSPRGHLGDRVGRWHPHVMFFLPQTKAAAWGADVPGSPVLTGQDPGDRLTIFMVPVRNWSDGTADPSPLQ
jgi:hypothetical protein